MYILYFTAEIVILILWNDLYQISYPRNKS